MVSALEMCGSHCGKCCIAVFCVPVVGREEPDVLGLHRKVIARGRESSHKVRVAFKPSYSIFTDWSGVLRTEESIKIIF